MNTDVPKHMTNVPAALGVEVSLPRAVSPQQRETGQEISEEAEQNQPKLDLRVEVTPNGACRVRSRPSPGLFANNPVELV